MEKNNELIEQLTEQLRNSIVKFQYQKTNGEFRDATGTLNMDNIPEEMHPANANYKKNDDVLKYFDVDKQSWRSFRKDSLINIYYSMEAKLKNKIIDNEGNECKIYDVDYLINTELTEEDLYYIFDTASLVYSLVIGEFRFAGINDMTDYDIIKMCKENERWVYEYFWTKKQHEDYIKLVTNVYMNIYQYKKTQAKNAAEWFIFQYGLTIKDKRSTKKQKD